MKDHILENSIKIIRNLMEEGEIANVVGDGEKSLGYNMYTGTPPVFSSKKKKKHPTGGRGSRKWWLQHLREK
jgi:hypothetical protein